MNMVALIPARAGSKRVPGKNTKLLGGKPLLQWTIEAAKASGVFAEIVVSTDDDKTGELAQSLGVRWCPRPDHLATDDSPDIEWVRHALVLTTHDAFAILRPTSPFRTAETIRRAYHEFVTTPCDSLRAVRPVREHPMKMWKLTGDGYMVPVYHDPWDRTPPYHSRPTQTLPEYYIQTASLEMAWTRVVTNEHSISGSQVIPFLSDDLDINTPADWAEAERLVTLVTV